jgi:membrane protease YdiL (CAAX protease family)
VCSKADWPGTSARYQPSWWPASSLVCFHLVTKTYAVIATLIGAYLGVLWLATENLLAPITTHAVYDFVALVYFLRAHVRQHRAARIKN